MLNYENNESKNVFVPLQDENIVQVLSKKTFKYLFTQITI